MAILGRNVGGGVLAGEASFVDLGRGVSFTVWHGASWRDEARSHKQRRKNMTEKRKVLESETHEKYLNDLAAGLVPESIEWIEELKNYRKYQGADARYFQKARLGVNVIGHAVRVCATIQNARTNDLVAERFARAVPAEAEKIGE